MEDFTVDHILNTIKNAPKDPMRSDWWKQMNKKVNFKKVLPYCVLIFLIYRISFPYSILLIYCSIGLVCTIQNCKVPFRFHLISYCLFCFSLSGFLGLNFISTDFEFYKSIVGWPIRNIAGIGGITLNLLICLLASLSTLFISEVIIEQVLPSTGPPNVL